MPNIKTKPIIQTVHVPRNESDYSRYLTDPESPRSPRRLRITRTDPATGYTWTTLNRNQTPTLVTPKKWVAAANASATKTVAAAVAVPPKPIINEAPQPRKSWAHRYVPLFELMKVLAGYGLPIFLVGISTLPFPFNVVGIGCAVLMGAGCCAVLWLAHHKRHPVAPATIVKRG